MSDERTSPTPNPPRCPVCASGFTETPGKTCPACGRVSGPQPASLPERDFRLGNSTSGFASCLGIVLRVIFTTIASGIACLTVCELTPGTGLFGGPGADRNGGIAFLVVFVSLTSFFLYMRHRNAASKREDSED